MNHQDIPLPAMYGHEEDHWAWSDFLQDLIGKLERLKQSHETAAVCTDLEGHYRGWWQELLVAQKAVGMTTVTGDGDDE